MNELAEKIAAEQRRVDRLCRSVSDRFATHDDDENIPFDTNEPNGETMSATKTKMKRPAKSSSRRTKPAVKNLSDKLIDADAIQKSRDDQLRRALRSTEGHEERLAKIKKTGASNAELKRWIAYEFGISGGSSGPDLPAVQYRGGENPAIWFDGKLNSKKPDLSGVALLDAVRRVHGIGRVLRTGRRG